MSSPAPNLTRAALQRLLRPAALAATCLATLLCAGDASAGQFQITFSPVGTTRQTVPGVYNPYASGFGASLAHKSWSWQSPLVRSTHVVNDTVSGAYLGFSGSTVTPNTTDGGEWACNDNEFIDSGGTLHSTNLLFLYSGGAVGVHVYYFLGPGETRVPEKNGSLPAVTVINHLDVLGNGSASYGPADNGTAAGVVDSSLLNSGDATLTINGHVTHYNTPHPCLIFDDQPVERLTVPGNKVLTSPTGKQYIDCGTYTVKASILMQAHQCYPAGTYVSQFIDPFPPFPFAQTFLRFQPFAAANVANDTGNVAGGPTSGAIRRGGPVSPLPPVRPPHLPSSWFDPALGRWCFSPAARAQIRAAGVDPDTDPRFRPVYGGTITHENGVSVSHSQADNALIDAADRSGDVADQKMIQQMERDQIIIIDEAINPTPDYVLNSPGTWDTDTGTYSDPGQPL